MTNCEACGTELAGTNGRRYCDASCRQRAYRRRARAAKALSQTEPNALDQLLDVDRVGQRDLALTANTYSHVLMDEAELDYSELLAA